jgi:hypothetical protein
MTLSTLEEATGGNVTFLDGGLFVFDYESRGVLPPVRGVQRSAPMDCAPESRASGRSPTAGWRLVFAHNLPQIAACAYSPPPGSLPMQHPAHFRASFVDLAAFQLFNDSGVVPPMTHLFASGIANCSRRCVMWCWVCCCRGSEWECVARGRADLPWVRAFAVRACFCLQVPTCIPACAGVPAYVRVFEVDRDCGPARGNKQFNDVSQAMLRMGVPPGTVIITEGAQR